MEKSNLELTEQELISKFGNDPNSSWMFAVVDKYKPMSQEDIKADMVKNQLPLGILMAHTNGDFNISSVIRSCNGFNLKEFHYFGKKKIDRRGCVGSHRYIDVKFHSDFQEIKDLKAQYHFVALENNVVRAPVNLVDYVWCQDKPSLIVVGEESCGLAAEVLELCDDFVEIPMFGAARSFNVSVAASICMYDFVSKNK